MDDIPILDEKREKTRQGQEKQDKTTYCKRRQEKVTQCVICVLLDKSDAQIK